MYDINSASSFSPSRIANWAIWPFPNPFLNTVLMKNMATFSLKVRKSKKYCCTWAILLLRYLTLCTNFSK